MTRTFELLFHRLAQLVGRTEFLRLGVRTRIVSALSPWAHDCPEPITEEFYGNIYRGDLSDFQDYCVHFLGGYELPELKLMIATCRAIDHCVAYDIGMSTGHHALVLASVCNKVHGFEPFDRVRAIALQRIRENRLRHVEIHGFGLGEKDEVLPYYWDKSNTNCMAGSFDAAHTEMPVHSQFEVRNGDRWREESRAHPPDFIKLDVEGFEAFALLGLQQTLKQSEPAILTEISWDGFDNIEANGGLRQIIPYDFEMFRVLPGRNLLFFDFRGLRLTPIEKISRPKKWGFNILILPHSRREQLHVLRRYMDTG